jgi:hypothetical protein
VQAIATRSGGWPWTAATAVQVVLMVEYLSTSSSSPAARRHQVGRLALDGRHGGAAGAGGRVPGQPSPPGRTARHAWTAMIVTTRSSVWTAGAGRVQAIATRSGGWPWTAATGVQVALMVEFLASLSRQGAGRHHQIERLDGRHVGAGATGVWLARVVEFLASLSRQGARHRHQVGGAATGVRAIATRLDGSSCLDGDDRHHQIGRLALDGRHGGAGGADGRVPVHQQLVTSSSSPPGRAPGPGRPPRRCRCHGGAVGAGGRVPVQLAPAGCGPSPPGRTAGPGRGRHGGAGGAGVRPARVVEYLASLSRQGARRHHQVGRLAMPGQR